MSRIIWVFVAVLSYSLPATPALAVGGIYVDNILITNDGNSVFADNFDSGRMDGWKAQNAILFRSQDKPPQFNIYLNRQNRGRAQIERRISLERSGKLELNAWIYLPAAEEQDNYEGSKLLTAGFVIYASDPEDHLTTGLMLQPKGKGYRAFAQWRDGVRKNVYVKSYTNEPVLFGKQWALATMRMDPVEKTVSLLLDGKLACRISYQPERFTSISSVCLFSDLGG